MLCRLGGEGASTAGRFMAVGSRAQAEYHVPGRGWLNTEEGGGLPSDDMQKSCACGLPKGR